MISITGIVLCLGSFLTGLLGGYLWYRKSLCKLIAYHYGFIQTLANTLTEAQKIKLTDILEKEGIDVSRR